MYRKNWSKASIIEVLEYVEQCHCQIREKLLKLQTLIDQTAQLQKDEYSRTFGSLQKFHPLFKTKIENHLAREEGILFPYIRQMDEAKRNPDTKFEFHSSSIKNPISQIEYDHDQTENVMFDKLRTMTNNYQLPQNASNPFKALYNDLKDFETNFGEHINLEEKTLFPWTIELELQLIRKR